MECHVQDQCHRVNSIHRTRIAPITLSWRVRSVIYWMRFSDGLAAAVTINSLNFSLGRRTHSLNICHVSSCIRNAEHPVHIMRHTPHTIFSFIATYLLFVRRASINPARHESQIFFFGRQFHIKIYDAHWRHAVQRGKIFSISMDYSHGLSYRRGETKTIRIKRINSLWLILIQTCLDIDAINLD